MKGLISSVLLFSLLSPSVPAQSDEAKAACDRAVQWLVSQQKEDGSYGGKVESTALALYAMGVSPRKYRDDDGPFMRRATEYLVSSVGSASDYEAVLLSGALGLLDPKKHAALLKTLEPRVRAIVFVRDPFSPMAGAKPEELVKQQLPNGSWGNSIDETALKVVTLSLKKPAPPPPPNLEEARAKGVKFLLSQRAGGLWGFPGKPEPGITGLALCALMSAPSAKTEESQKAVDEGLKYLVSLAKPDGAIFDKGLANYTTCIAIMALADSGREEFKPLVQNAQKFLISLQADEKTGYLPADKFYGGIGYGNSQRPDLSNLQFALEALRASGLDKDHEVFQKAVTFLSRSQNRSESNPLSIEIDGVTYVAGNDGGGTYYPGNSMAGYETLPNGFKVPRSYGSMTYALLRGYLFAGLPKEDPRLQAAVSWIQKNYTLNENPGFDKRDALNVGMQGYYYYLFTMAKALDGLGLETIKSPDGVSHNWREEMKAKILSMQKPDGSWVNELSQRWYEGNPVLATAYALATLKYAK